MSEWLMSVDPASVKAHAWALWRDSVLHSVGRSVAEHWPPMTTDCTVAIENQFAGRNGSSAIKLAQSAGHLIGRLRLSMTDVEWHSPLRWKRSLCPWRAPKTKTIETYAVHLRVLELLHEREIKIYRDALWLEGAQPSKMDLADAVGIGLVSLDRV
jgi:hypothetical protein